MASLLGPLRARHGRKRSPSDSDCDSGSTCSVVMSLVMQDMGPLAARDSADSRGTGGGVAPETMSSQLRAALGMSGAWFEMRRARLPYGLVRSYAMS